MSTNTVSSGVAEASVSAPSTGEALRFAAYVVDLIGTGRVEYVSVEGTKLHLTTLDTLAVEAAVHLLGLKSTLSRDRVDVEPDERRPEGYSSWMGTSGPFSVYLSAPLALGALPQLAPRDWSAAGVAA
ncbi:hypothetical protein [Promicromonospora sp. NPDC060271]|uniref:hypothetical protein n=1 Tax=Promicromonospora sp. NPDC060271 TaxID=3347089 RepID=UPI00364B53A9